MFETEDVDQDQELGPGTDLILSLLSVVITILAVVSIGQPELLETETVCPAGDCQAVVTEDPAVVREALNKAQRTINTLRSDLILSEAALRSMENRLDADKIVQAGDVLELHDEILAVFDRNKSELSPEDLPILKRELYPLYETVSDKGANIIRIHGHASPEPRGIGDGKHLDRNMDLSVERSLTILHALHQLGVPYHCMVVEGYGRNQSAFLNSYLNKNNITVDEWDRMYLQGFNPELSVAEREAALAQLEKLYQRDRRVTLVAAFEPDSPCSARELSDHLFNAVTL